MLNFWHPLLTRCLGFPVPLQTRLGAVVRQRSFIKFKPLSDKPANLPCNDPKPSLYRTTRNLPCLVCECLWFKYGVEQSHLQAAGNVLDKPDQIPQLTVLYIRALLYGPSE